jgi:hypothetical protein
MILTYRRPDPPDTHVLTMVNNVIEVLNYVIAAHPPPLNYVIADSRCAGQLRLTQGACGRIGRSPVNTDLAHAMPGGFV